MAGDGVVVSIEQARMFYHPEGVYAVALNRKINLIACIRKDSAVDNGPYLISGPYFRHDMIRQLHIRNGIVDEVSLINLQSRSLQRGLWVRSR